MEMTADTPEELLASAEQFILGTRKHAGADEVGRVAQSIHIFGDPKQRVEVPEAAFAILDIWLDEIARAAGLRDAAVAFGELRRDEFGGPSLHDLALEPRPHGFEKPAVAENKARFKERRADGHVFAGTNQTFLDQACRVADFLAEIPKHIEDRLGDAFPARPRRGREQEKEIDVGTRRKGRPPIAAYRRDHEGFAGRTVCGRMNIGRHIIENLADQLVFDMGEMAGASEATPIGLERFTGERASVAKGGAKRRDRLRAHDMRRLAPRMERRDFGAQTRAMEIGPMRQVDPIAPGVGPGRSLAPGGPW